MEASLPQLILPIKLERSSERLTSLGGLVVLEALARAVGLREEVDRVLAGPKSGRGYAPHAFVQGLVWMLHAGGRRLEDLRELRAEHEVLGALGLEAVPDAGTVGDWLRRQGEKGAAAIEPISRKLITPCLESVEEVILDVEATEVEAEKQDAHWTGILEFVQGCEAALPTGKRIYFRSDSVAYQAAVINYYSQPGRTLSISADLDVAVKREIANLPETAWPSYRTPEGIATDREIAETVHSMKESEQAFRLIVLRWPNPQPSLFEADRYGYHAVATNREEAASAVIWKHDGRGNSENWHKELKSGLGMEQMPCGQFEANAMYFAIGVLAYNLAQLLKRRVLPAGYRTATVATLRWKVYRLAGKLVRHARGWMLQIKADLEKWRLLQSARVCCATLWTWKEKANREGQRKGGTAVCAPGGKKVSGGPMAP